MKQGPFLAVVLTWTAGSATAGTPPPANLAAPVGAYVFDPVNGVLLGLSADDQVYGAGDSLRKRGFPADKDMALVLDVDKRSWVVQPRLANGAPPPVTGTNMVHHFYDPVQNVVVIYRGPCNSPAMETWLYRYKRAAATDRPVVREQEP
jgi:hypothetical protein